MAGEYPVWQRLGEKILYRGRFEVIEYKATLPNGDTTTYEVIHNDGGAAAVLIKTADDQIILTHQFRFPLNRWIYDLPGGGVAANETPQAAAIRECREEVGVAPSVLKELAVFHPNPGRADWIVHLYYCEAFEVSSLDTQDASETVEKVLMPIAELDRRIRNQEIVDPALLVAWYTAKDKGFIKL